MEPAKIEWDRIESFFVVDQVYENINAPQWVDLLSSSPLSPDDDVAWFCRQDCKHPRTAEDFLNSTPSSSSSKLRSVSVSKLLEFVDWTRREPNLKKRGGAVHSSTTTSNEDTENQDPNFSTPTRQIHYLNKAAIKSSALKSKETGEEGTDVGKEEEFTDILLGSDDKNKPGLKPTQSAKDLFGGSKDLFGKVAEFCNELKRMASRTKDYDDKSCSSSGYKPFNSNKLQEDEPAINVLGVRLEEKSEATKERLPFVEIKTAERSPAKYKPRKNKIKRADNDENSPISLNLSNIKHKGVENLMTIRTNPPTPQGFSITRDPVKTTPSKCSKSRLMERDILQELGQNKTVTEDGSEKSHTKNASVVGGKGRTLDVFWFLKPCTLSS